MFVCPSAWWLAAEEHFRRNPGRPEISYVVITKEDVIEAIEKIPNGAAPGPDGVVPCLLKKAKKKVATMLADIYQHSIETGEIPQILEMGLISPIHKGESASDPANFRPISLTSHLSKTEERIVRKTLVTFLEVNDKMDPNQHGSRQGRSTLSQLLEHHHEIVEILEKGENVDCIYTDFSKAFHKCDLGILMNKLKTLGVTGRLARWIHSFLSNRKQKVVVDGTTSKETEVTSGVPEGTVLGPLLFLIYISDIGENIKSTKKVYVDDTKLIKSVTNEKDVEDLQEELDILYEWAEENNMKFNGKKFQVVRYGKDENLKDETLYFTENTENIVERYETVRDLGVMMSDDATFKDQIEKVAKKVRQKTGWVLRTFYSRKTLLMKTLFKTLVVPHIDYCSQLWMPVKPVEILKIEKLQKDFLNRIPALRGENYWEKLKILKMISLQRRQERYRIIYIWKILEGLAPNCGIQSTSSEDRRQGRKCKVQNIKTGAKASAKALREQTFQVHGPQLFNSLPPFLRNMTKCSIEIFKEQLDKYLMTIPDEPSVPGLTPSASTPDARPSNSLLHQRPRQPGREERRGRTRPGA